MLPNQPLHPALLVLYSILAPYSSSLFAANPGDLVLPTVVALTTIAVLFGLLALFYGDRHKAAILLSLASLAFFFFEEAMAIFNASAGGRRLGYVSVGVSLAAAAVLLARLRQPLVPITRTLNVASTTAVAFPLVAIFTSFGSPQPLPPVRGSPVLPDPPFSRPDIYYIVLDGYGRSDILRRLFGYDNGPFLASLRDQGFVLPQHTRSNYVQTLLSVTSALNMSYLDELPGTLDPRATDRRHLVELLHRNATVATLRGLGYEFVAVPSAYPLTDIRSADIYRQVPDHLPAFHELLIDRSPLSILRIRFGLFLGSPYDHHRESIRFALRSLPHRPNTDRPIFTFAHIVTPHPPFVFAANGDPVQPDRPFSLTDGKGSMPRDEYVRGYGEQISFLNRELKSAIDAILASSRDAAIIIQSDHGPKSLFDEEQLDGADVGEAFGNFTAYYLPRHTDAAPAIDSLTPVNTFRLVFNHLFKANYELLQDRSYYSPWSHPYRFTEVTDRVQ